MNIRSSLRVILTLSAVLIVGCSSKPVLYPNSKYQQVGKEGAQKDVDRCMERADEFLDSPKGKQILKGAGQGSVVGGAMGAVWGLFTGDIVKSLAVGAASGAAGGAAAGAITPDRLKQSFVTKCLQKKQYEVVGWD